MLQNPTLASSANSQNTSWLAQAMRQFIELCSLTPASLIAFVGRFSIAAVFWKGGQTKIEGFKLDFVAGEFNLGWPRMSDSAVDLFRDEYHMPFPELVAPFAAFADHCQCVFG